VPTQPSTGVVQRKAAPSVDETAVPPLADDISVGRAAIGAPANIAAPAGGLAEAFAAYPGALIQRKAEGDEPPEAVHEAAASGVAAASEPLPFLDQIQASFGRHDIQGVRAHIDAAACAAMGAKAYATGNDVVFAAAPDVRMAAHEAAHVVQQRAGIHLDGGVGKGGDRYEQHADAVADVVVRRETAEPLLDELAGGAAAPSPRVQRWEQIGTERYVASTLAVEAAPFSSPRSRPIVELAVVTGTETEWRGAIPDLANNARLVSFLRAAYVPQSRFARHARAHVSSHPIAPIFAQWVTPQASRTLERVPTFEERMHLAKALCMRGDRALPDVDMPAEGLMDDLIAECQEPMLAGLAAGNHSVSEIGVQSMATFSGREGTEQIIASACSSLVDGMGRAMVARSASQRDTSLDLIRNAVYALNGGFEALDESYAGQEARVGLLIDTEIVGVLTALALAPECALVAAALSLVTPALASAMKTSLTTPSTASVRRGRIKRAATGMVERYDYAAAGITDRALRHDLHSAIDNL
jgi:hypothetical protein